MTIPDPVQKPEYFHPEGLSGRDLDAAVAEHVLGWKPCPVGPDYDGANACVILSPDGTIPNGFELPRKGVIHPAYLVPPFHRDLHEAIRLAQRFGRKSFQIEGNDLSELPTRIVRTVLQEVLAKTPGGTE